MTTSDPFDESGEASWPERRLRAQYNIVRVLAESPSLADATPQILRAMCESLGWEFAALWRVDPLAQALRCVDIWKAEGVDAHAFEALTREITLPYDVGLPGRVWASGAPAWIEEIADDLNFPRAPIAVADGFHSGFAFPIQLGSTVLGVIESFHSTPVEPDEELSEMMNALGSLVGQFIERKQAEDSMSESEARKTAILEASIDAIISMDHEGNTVEFNPAAEAMFGFDRDEIIGKPMAEFIIPEEFRDKHWEGLSKFLETGKGRLLGRRTEMAALRSDGTEFAIELTIVPVETEGPPFFTGFIRDITHRKQSEREVAELLIGQQQAQEEAETAQARYESIANQLQKSLLPPTLPTIPGMRLAARYEPAASQVIDVGGDFFDVFLTGGDKWVFVIGDVCGKGAEAAGLTGLARHTVRAAAMQVGAPAEILTVLNDAILQQRSEEEMTDERFATVALATIQPDEEGAKIRIASAGHPAPLILRASGEVEWITTDGIILGVFDEVELDEDDRILHPGDMLILYTDGVPEARGPDGIVLGQTGLRKLVQSCAGCDAPEAADKIRDHVIEMQGGRARDDVAILVARIPPTLEAEIRGGFKAAAEARILLEAVRPLVSVELFDDLRLIVNELVTNSIRHAKVSNEDSIRLTMTVSPRVVRGAVSDRGEGFEPAARGPEADQGSGWGLHILDRVADRWGVSRGFETTVWFEIDR